MRVAIPEWRGRVSPVFDVARNLLLMEVENGTSHNRRYARLAATDPTMRATAVSGLGVDVLICGAISWPLEMALGAAGVRVIPQTCGDVEQILSAFMTDGLEPNAFLMPGCCRRHQQGRGRGGRGRQRRGAGPG